MGIAVVDEDRLAGAGRERQLAGERFALHRRRREVAKVIQPDLADRHGAGVGRQPVEPLPIRLRRGGDEVWVDPHRGDDEAGMLSGELERRLGRFEVVAGDQDPLDAARQRPLDDGATVGVEGLVLQVTMRVDQARDRLARRRGAQGAASASSSTRGKTGRACPVRHSVGPPPQASRALRPGPPAPRSS